MNYGLAKERVLTLISQRNAGWVFCFALLFLALTQTFGLIYIGVLAHEARIIERPVGLNSNFWISDKGVSGSFLAGQARYLLMLYLTVSPRNVDNQRESFLNAVAPESYDALKRELLRLDARIKKEAITSVFYPEQVQIDGKHFIAKIHGELEIRSGDAKPLIQHKTFVLQFIYRQGQLYLLKLKESS